MSARRLAVWTLIASALFSSACGVNGSMLRSELHTVSDGVAVELAETPFHPQTTDQCGPAALATALNTTGIAVTANDLRAAVYIPGRQGSLQLELLAATRSYDRIPYIVEPDPVSLLRELQAGRPVLVLQKLSTGIAPVWHYAVVVGYLPDEDKFILRSGRNKRHLMTTSRFLRSWRRAGSWGLIVLAPGELPAARNAAAFTKAVAGLESIGKFEAAVAGYQSAVGEWPDHAIAWLGLANSHYALGHLDIAEQTYAHLLSIEPGNVIALNNLSLLLAERGEISNALQTIEFALSLTESGGTLHDLVSQTRSEIRRRRTTLKNM